MSRHRRPGVEPDALYATPPKPYEPEAVAAPVAVPAERPPAPVEVAPPAPAVTAPAVTAPAATAVDTEPPVSRPGFDPQEYLAAVPTAEIPAADAEAVFVDEHVGVAPPIAPDLGLRAAPPAPPGPAPSDPAPSGPASEPAPSAPAPVAEPAREDARTVLPDPVVPGAQDEQWDEALPADGPAPVAEPAAPDLQQTPDVVPGPVAVTEPPAALPDLLQTPDAVPATAFTAAAPAGPAAPSPAAPPPAPGLPSSPERPRSFADDPAAVVQASQALRERDRRRLQVRAGAGVLVVALAVAAGVALTRGGATARTATTAAAQQRTTLLVLGDAGGTAEVAGIAGVDASTRRAVLALLPTRLLVSPTGGAPGPLSQVGGSDLGLVGAAVSDATGVRVDGAWRLTPAGLAGLVDSVGGVTVDVDVDVPDPANASSLLASAGKAQKLDGKAAAAFAGLLRTSEDETARLSRFQSVFDALVGSLPTSTAGLTAALAKLGAGSTTAPGTNPVPLLQAIETARGSQTEPIYQVVATTSLDLGAGSTPVVRLETQQVQQLQTQTFPGASLPVAGSSTKVFLIVGAGSPDSLQKVRGRLVAAGFRYAGARNDDAGLTRTKTVVVVPVDDAANRARGLAVATALGLDASVLKVTSDASSLADVTVLLGSDVTGAVEATASPPP